MTDCFVEHARRRATQWKATSPTLPEGARGPAPYLRDGKLRGMFAYCLPAGYATYNLLPDARDTALSEFRRHDIAWHAQTPLGPTNHLLSSQVQCVNALEPLATDPERLIAAFADVLPIAEPLRIEGNRLVAFEYIGDRDYLGEVPTGPRHRGSHTTSADAAIHYRTPDGRIEVALIEWKYVEDYRGRELSLDKKDIRRGRYRTMWDATDGPLRTDVLPYDDVFVEPFHQLMRQQLLAHEMEKACEHDADLVRVVHVAPVANEALRASLNRDSHRAAGDDVLAIWPMVLREPDRFVSIGGRRFCAVGSADYRARYDHD